MSKRALVCVSEGGSEVGRRRAINRIQVTRTTSQAPGTLAITAASATAVLFLSGPGDPLPKPGALVLSCIYDDARDRENAAY